jgi:hypothetical protein
MAGAVACFLYAAIYGDLRVAAVGWVAFGVATLFEPEFK